MDADSVDNVVSASLIGWYVVVVSHGRFARPEGDVVAAVESDVVVVVSVSSQWRYGRPVVCASVVVDASLVLALVSASITPPRHGRNV